MRRLVLILLLLTTKAFAYCNIGTQCFYPLATNGSGNCGEAALTTVGSVPFTTIQGFACAGPFSDSNYFTLPASLVTVLNASPNNYTIEFDMYALAAANGVYLAWSSGDYYQLQAGPTFVIVNSSIGLNRASALNTWKPYQISYNNSGSPKRIIYDNGVSSSTDSTSGAFSIGTFFIGRYTSGGFSLNGYMKNFRISTVTRTGPFPTTDINKVISGNTTVNGSGAVLGGGNVIGAGSSN